MKKNKEWCGCETIDGIIVKFCKNHFRNYWGKDRWNVNKFKKDK